MTKLRFVVLIAVLVAAASIAAASAQTQTRKGSAQPGAGRPSRSPTRNGSRLASANMVGVVGGDIVGKFGGAVFERTVNGNLVHLDAIYIVIAPDPAESFTAHVEGTEDLTTLHAVLDGRVVDGFMKRAHVNAEFDVISCTQAPSGTCFQGTISVTRNSDA